MTGTFLLTMVGAIVPLVPKSEATIVVCGDPIELVGIDFLIIVAGSSPGYVPSFPGLSYVVWDELELQCYRQESDTAAGGFAAGAMAAMPPEDYLQMVNDVAVTLELPDFGSGPVSCTDPTIMYACVEVPYELLLSTGFSLVDDQGQPTPCPPPSVGIQPNCFTQTPCPPGQIGVLVNGQGICAQVNLCPEGQIGAIVNGTPICVPVPTPCSWPEVGVEPTCFDPCDILQPDCEPGVPPCPDGEIGTPPVCIGVEIPVSSGNGTQEPENGTEESEAGPFSVQAGTKINIVGVADVGHNAPEGRPCNLSALERTAEALQGETGVEFHAVCAVDLAQDPNLGITDLPGWEAPASWDADPICASLRAYLEQDEPRKLKATNNIMVGWVRNANHIGRTCGDLINYAAEYKWGQIGYPKDSTAMHEVSHDLGGNHVPCWDDHWTCKYKNYLCRQIHWGHWRHWVHSYRSTMNYCHMFWGVKELDTTWNNKATVTAGASAIAA